MVWNRRFDWAKADMGFRIHPRIGVLNPVPKPEKEPKPPQKNPKP